MKEKILALLQTKFAGVRKDGLAQLATAMSIQAADETEATALVEKISLDKVNDFVKDWRKDVDKEVSNSTKTFETTLKEKYDLVEKKKEDTPPGTPPGTPPNPTDIAAIIAAEIAKAVNPLQQKLQGYESEGIKKTRLQTLESKLKDVPETFKAQKLKDFGRMNFDNDDSFNEYLTETETDITAFNQELADKGLAGQGKPFMGSKNQDGISSAVASFITSKSEAGNSLGGKEI